MNKADISDAPKYAAVYSLTYPDKTAKFLYATKLRNHLFREYNEQLKSLADVEFKILYTNRDATKVTEIELKDKANEFIREYNKKHNTDYPLYDTPNSHKPVQEKKSVWKYKIKSLNTDNTYYTINDSMPFLGLSAEALSNAAEQHTIIDNKFIVVRGDEDFTEIDIPVYWYWFGYKYLDLDVYLLDYLTVNHQISYEECLEQLFDNQAVITKEQFLDIKSRISDHVYIPYEEYKKLYPTMSSTGLMNYFKLTPEQFKIIEYRYR